MKHLIIIAVVLLAVPAWAGDNNHPQKRDVDFGNGVQVGVKCFSELNFMKEETVEQKTAQMIECVKKEAKRRGYNAALQ